MAGGASITAMDVSTGSTLWKADTSYGKPLFLAVAGEQVFIISNYESGIFGTNYWKSSRGYVEAFLAKDGTRVWGGKIGPVLSTAPAFGPRPDGLGNARRPAHGFGFQIRKYPEFRRIWEKNST